MATRVRAKRPHTTEETAPIEDEQPIVPSALTEQAQDWIDEIDGVLQENAEQFVREYVQKGGE